MKAGKKRDMTKWKRRQGLWKRNHGSHLANLRRLRFEHLEERRLLAVLAVGDGELFDTISDAVAAAQTGDIVDVVDLREYAETITVDKSISLRSQGATINGGVQFQNVDFAYLTGFNITGPARGVDVFNSQVAIVGNYLFENCHFQQGAAIHVGSGSRALIADNLIADNDAGVSGCGAAPFLGAGAIHVAANAEAVISRNEIRDNWLWYAGAVSVQGSAYVDGNYIHHNSGDFGGGVYVFGQGDAQLSHNVITENVARFRTGAGLLMEDTASAFAWNNTIAGNPGAGLSLGYGIFTQAANSLEAHNNVIVFDDVGIHAPASANVTFNLLSEGGVPYSGGVAAGAGSIVDTPIFVSAATGDYNLAPGSPGHNVGNPTANWRNLDSSTNTLGAEGGPATFALEPETLASLAEILETSSNYFFDSQVLNTEIGWSRGFFGDGPWRENVGGALIPRLTPLPVGFGNHVNMNEVTLGFIMQGLAALNGVVAPAQAINLVQTGLQTMRTLQTSNDPNAYHPSGAFYRYETRISRPTEPADQNRRVDELTGITGHDFQQLITSDDNALARRNLGLLKGILNQLPGAAGLPPLIDAIRADIQMRQFIADDGNSIVFEIKDNVKSSSWDRRAAEGSLIAAEMLDAGEISLDQFEHLINQMDAPVANWESDSKSPAIPNSPLPAAFGDTTINDGNFHGAAFMYALRMIHGYVATPWEHPQADYQARAMGPATQSQMEYALHNNLSWLSSQVMTGELDLVGLVKSPVNDLLHRFPGNDGTFCGCGGFSLKPDPRFATTTGDPLDTDLARATGAHAILAPFYRWQHVQPAHLFLADAWQNEYRERFWDPRFGFSEALPWQPDSTAHAWTDGNGVARFTDMGDAFETLGKAYSGIAAHDALNASTPLASFSIQSDVDKAVAGFLDSNEPIDPALFPSRLSLTVDTTTLVEGGVSTQATVRRINSNISQPLSVTISKPDGQFITLPPTLTIPAWDLEATFSISALRDAILDGDVEADIVVTAPLHQQASQTLTAIDAEFISLQLLETQLGENAQTTTLQINRSDVNSTFDLDVTLAATPGGDLDLPTTFTLAAGAASTPLDITTIDNNLLDGERDHTISVSAADYADDAVQITILDHEFLTLTASPDSVHEEFGANALTLRIQRSDVDDLSNPVNVVLDLPAPFQTASLQVTIPGDDSETTVDVGILDNTQQGPTPLQIQITAQANGFIDGQDNVEVLDEHDDFPYHNWRDPFNVVNDTPAVNLVDPLHVVAVIREAGGPTSLTGTPLGNPPRYPDVIPNNRADLLDAFASIDDIRERLGAGEGEPAALAETHSSSKFALLPTYRMLTENTVERIERTQGASTGVRSWRLMDTNRLAQDDLIPRGLTNFSAIDAYFRALLEDGDAQPSPFDLFDEVGTDG